MIPVPRDEWTDEDLDLALARLGAGSEPDLTRLRAAVLSDARKGQPEAGQAGRRVSRRRFLRRTGLAVGVAAAAAAALILPTIQWSDSTPPAAAVNAAAAQALNRAADSIKSTDLHVPAGKFLYIREDAWWATIAEGKYFYLQKNVLETWIPADWHEEWVQKRRYTGDIKWIYGTSADLPAGQLTTLPMPAVIRGTCGQYFPDNLNMCTAPGYWSGPTLPWLATVPTTAGGVYDSLFAESNHEGKPDETYAAMLENAATGLRSGLLPANVRANLYRAVARIPGIQITDTAMNLAGRKGVGFAMTDPRGISHQIVIDVNTGAFLGERSVITKQDGRTPGGTESERTAVYFAIADTAGRPPANG